MVERKVIKFGNSSYVVTLPNEWVKQNKLDKGDLIEIKQNENSIIISPKKETEEKSVEIKIDNMPLKLFNKKLISYYLKNYKFIKLTGNKVIDRLEEIRIFKEKLSSIEIYEIGTDFIILKDLSDPQKLDVQNLIEKIVDIVKILFEQILEDGKTTFIGQIDSNINKLTFLTYKTINYNLDKQIKVEEIKNAIYYWRIVTALETTGDILKRVARYMARDKDNTKSRLKELIKTLMEYYEFIVGLINKDVNVDNNLKLYLDKKQSILREFEEVKSFAGNEANMYLVVTQLLKDIIGRLDVITLSVIDIHSH